MTFGRSCPQMKGNKNFVDRINMIDRIKDIVDSSAILVADIW